MMDYEEYAHRLEQKGWPKEDIQKTITIMQNADDARPKKLIFLDNFIYWLVMIISIFGNLVVSIALVPFLLGLEGALLYFFVAIMAAVFGMLFDFLIREVESKKEQGFIVEPIFIPSLAVINIFYITDFSNYLSASLDIGNRHNPFFVSVVYVFFFVLPYVANRYYRKI